MKRRTLRDQAFQTFWRLQRPLTLGVRGVVINADGHVLLVRHTYTPGWHFPGGGVERGETAIAALKRECHEEAAVEVASVPELVSVHANHAFFPNDHVLVFKISDWTQGPVRASGEIAEIGFFDPLVPPPAITGGTQRRLNELFGGAAPSESW